MESESPFRRRNFADVFSRKGTYSPSAADRQDRSEVPRNTIEIEPKYVVFRSGGHSRSQIIYTIVSAIVFIAVLLLLIGSISYHFLHNSSGTSDKLTNAQAEEKDPNAYMFSAVQSTTEFPEPDDDGDSIDSLPPAKRSAEDNVEKKSIMFLKSELNRAKSRLRRSLGTYHNRKYHKYCEGSDCKELVGSPHRHKAGIEWDQIYNDLIEIRKKIREYEESVWESTHIPFNPYSLLYPRVTPLRKTSNRPFNFIHWPTATEITTRAPVANRIGPITALDSLPSLYNEVTAMTPTTSPAEEGSTTNSLSTETNMVSHDISTRYSADSYTTIISVVENGGSTSTELSTLIELETTENERVSGSTTEFLDATSLETIVNKESTEASTSTSSVDSSAHTDDSWTSPSPTEIEISTITPAPTVSEEIANGNDLIVTKLSSSPTEIEISTITPAPTVSEEIATGNDLIVTKLSSSPTEIEISTITPAPTVSKEIATENDPIITELSSSSTLLETSTLSPENIITTTENPITEDGSTSTEFSTSITSSVAKTADGAAYNAPRTTSMSMEDEALSTMSSTAEGTTMPVSTDTPLIIPNEKTMFTSSPEDLDVSKYTTPGTTNVIVGDENLSTTTEEDLATTLNVEIRKEKTLFQSKENNKLEEQILEGVPKSKGEVLGLSLEDLRNQLTMENRKKWESKVVAGADDIKLPTGPDSSFEFPQSLHTGQQLSYYPTSGMSHVVVPFHMCFYANPSTEGLPQPRTAFNLPPLLLPGFSQPSTPSPTAKPNSNVFNIYMNNVPAAPPTPHLSSLSSPGVLEFPSQQHFARFIVGQNQGPLFCSTFQPSMFRFPTVPGTTEYGRVKCVNCEEPTKTKQEDFDWDSDREDVQCPEGMSRCKDGQLCIPKEHWCDNRVHCEDSSDEAMCSCKDRLQPNRLCDGYVDCPGGEDETGCPDCPHSSFSCGTGDEFNNCIPLEKRCDGSTDCENRLDEQDCSILAPSLVNVSHHVSYDEGFLLRNHRGVWYLICSESRRQTWAEEACNGRMSRGSVETEQRDIPENVGGPFLSERRNGDMFAGHHCKGHVGVYVTCPPAQCGKSTLTDENSSDWRGVNRFQRLVDQKNAPVSVDDRSVLEWVEKSKEIVKKEYNVKDVEVKVVPLESMKRQKRMETVRVVGGKESMPNAWPWAVALYRDGAFHCGGTLLDHQWVLTAAHCVTDYTHHYYEARIGLLRRSSFSPSEVVRRISHVIDKKNYDAASMKNDLALLKLSEPVLFGKWTKPACLPVDKSDFRKKVEAPLAGTPCVAIGWGAIREKGFDPDGLREVEMPVLRKCKHRADVEGNEICAGLYQGGKDTCQGDSGGPLLCRDSVSDAWYVAGVVSHGEGCARPHEPGAYTRVSLYMDWIINKTTSALPVDMPIQTCPGFQCTSHPGLCLSSRFRCNGLVNCLKGEDEQNCIRSKIADDDTVVAASKPNSHERAVPRIDELIFNYTLDNSMMQRFTCKNIEQNVPAVRRCDGFQDCEDATDEMNCTCRHVLFRSHHERICDGVVHCKDGSDEESCYKCPSGYFNCRKSHQCLEKKNNCDGHRDCVFGEDEENCVALSEDLNLRLDEFGNPAYRLSGVLFRNRKGVWGVDCMEKIGFREKGDEGCTMLGSNLLRYDFFETEKSSKDGVENSSGSSGENCVGLNVTCSERVVSTPFDSPGTGKSWQVSVKVDGETSCAAVLLTNSWIISSSDCFPLNISSKAIFAEFPAIYPPTHIRIDRMTTIPNTEILLMHLAQEVTLSRTSRPLGLPLNKTTSDLTSCIAMGENSSVKVQLTDSECEESKVCGRRVGRVAKGCKSSPWVGAIVCDSSDGWMPVGVFKEVGGLCGFQVFSYTNVLGYFAEIKQALDSSEGSTLLEAAVCEGYQCAGGKCLTPKQVCDGVPHCPYNDDEDGGRCAKQVPIAGLCHREELQCYDGTCISRHLFGNGVEDCPDGSDEPRVKNCVAYLNLTASHRLCDGTRNCYDKSDELYSLCKGKGASFSCPRSEGKIPNEFVCDGETDCPSGEDELHCSISSKVPRVPKHYEFRNISYGLMHSVCGANLTSEKADQLCAAKGYTHVQQMEEKLRKPTLVNLDHFSSVRLNNVTTIALRGDRSFATVSSHRASCPITYFTCA